MRGAIPLFGEPVELADVRDDTAAGVPVRVYRPVAEGVLPAIVHLHGGGWVLGDLDTHDAVCRDLAAETGCAVVAVDYRLAPEHPFPAALEDSLASRPGGRRARARPRARRPSTATAPAAGWPR